MQDEFMKNGPGAVKLNAESLSITGKTPNLNMDAQKKKFRYGLGANKNSNFGNLPKRRTVQGKLQMNFEKVDKVGSNLLEFK